MTHACHPFILWFSLQNEFFDHSVLRFDEGASGHKFIKDHPEDCYRYGILKLNEMIRNN